MPLFDIYWRSVGLPLSRVKGALTDAVPFSIVEASLWIGATATILFIASQVCSRGVLARKRVRRGLLLAGPVFLITLGLGQGAFPWSLAPTAWRTPLAVRLNTSPLSEDTFRDWVAMREVRLRETIAEPSRWTGFVQLSEHAVLQACDQSLDSVLSAASLPPGRSVRNFKDMGPWTTTLGLAYGGPAFHDPFFGEIAIIRDRDLPAPHHWRLIAACHEAAHAKGFTREMDAEILTQLALFRLKDPLFHIIADIHFLQKTGLKVNWPDSLITEAVRVRARRKAAESRQPVVIRLRTWARQLGLQNSAVKYGARDKADSWNPYHPFFATIHQTTGELHHGP